jgi:hypothetical protein
MLPLHDAADAHMKRIQGLARRFRQLLRIGRRAIARVDCWIIGHTWWPEHERHEWPEYPRLDDIARCVHCGTVSRQPTRYFRVTVGK